MCYPRSTGEEILKKISLAVRSCGTIQVPRLYGLEVEPVIINLDDRPVTRSVVKRFDAVICPGNSFGHMTGGFDLGVVETFGKEVEEFIQSRIQKEYYGMLPVGHSICVVLHERLFVYIPTMFVPTRFTDAILPYMSMYSALIAIRNWEREAEMDTENILCPLFCAGTGGSTEASAIHQQLTAIGEYDAAFFRNESNGIDHLFKDGMGRYMMLTERHR